MKYEAGSPEAYIAQLPPDRQEAMARLRQVIRETLPGGFEETMSYGMIGYVVPHSLYPDGYHCDPSLPLPFLNIASQKQHIGFYHMGLYSDPGLMQWFKEQYAERVPARLDMGKSCIRFKKPGLIPFELLGELCGKMGVEDWIALYEGTVRR